MVKKCIISFLLYQFYFLASPILVERPGIPIWSRHSLYWISLDDFPFTFDFVVLWSTCPGNHGQLTIGIFCRRKRAEASIRNSTCCLARYTLATSFTFYAFVQCFTWNSVPGSSLLLGHYCNFNSFYSSAPYPRVWNNSNSLVSHKAWYGRRGARIASWTSESSFVECGEFFSN